MAAAVTFYNIPVSNKILSPEESDKLNVIVESLYNFKEGLIGAIVPADVDVKSTIIGFSNVAL